MKKCLFFFLLIPIALFAQTDAGDAPISFGTAFAHCASTGSYWLSLIITVVILAALWIALEVEAKKANFDPSNVEKVLLVATVFAIGLALLMRPCEVAANTSISSAAKGLWLGY